MATVLERPAQLSQTLPPATSASATRNIAVDAYRGFVMFLMMAEVLRLATCARRHYPGNWFWAFLAYHQTHVGVGRLFAARHDPAVVLVSGGRGAAVLDREPDRQGRHVRRCSCTRSGGRCCWWRWASFCGRYARPITLLHV